jgi:transposase
MARKPELIKLSGSESSSLTNILTRGSTAARTQTRARILDLLNRGTHPEEIAATLSIGIATVFNVKRRYLTEGLESALYDKSRRGKPATISGEAKAKITALACSDAPPGHARWTLRLLAGKAVEAGFVDSISHNAVKEILKKTNFDRT